MGALRARHRAAALHELRRRQAVLDLGCLSLISTIPIGGATIAAILASLPRRILPTTGLAATAALLAACDTGIHFPGADAVDAQVSAACLEAESHADFEFLRDEVFPLSCANFSSCHQGQRPASSLNLTRTRAFEQLVGMPAISVAGWTRVVPGDPGASYILVKLGDVDGPLGDRGTFMPPGGVPLCSGKVGAVRRWIEAGAPPPGGGPDAGSPDGGGGLPDAAP